MQNNKRSSLFIPAVILASVVFLAVVGFFGLEYYATSILRQEIDRQIQDMSAYVRVDYDRVGVNWLGFAVNMHKVRIWKPPLPGRITIDKVSVRDFTSIGIRWIPTVVVLNDVALTNEDSKIIARRLATSFSLTRIPTEEEMNQNLQVLLDNFAAGKIELDNVVYSGPKTHVNLGNLQANYSISGTDSKNIGVEINNVKSQSANLLLDSKAFSFTASLDKNGVLRHFSQKVTDFSFNFPTERAERNGILAKLTSLGYDRLAFGLDLTYDYQPDAKDLRIAWDGTAKDMGQLQLHLNLTDYQSPPVPVSGGLVRLLEYLGQLRTPATNASLRGFTAKYRDFGLAPRLIKAEAQSQGLTPEQLTQSLVGSINGTMALLPLPASIKEQVRAINRFLQDPKEIQVAITCKPPVRLKNLEQGSVLGYLDLLGKTEVKITAK